MKAHGSVHAGGLVFDSPGEALMASSTPPNSLVLDRLSGNWHVTRQVTGWRLRVDSLDLAKGEQLASLLIDTSESPQPNAPGQWIHGTLNQAPLAPVVAVARWLAPHFDLAGIHLDGTARNLTFDWASARPEGEKLRASAKLEDVALAPRSRDYVLGGLAAEVVGSESD